MTVIRALLIAFSTYSALPVPQFPWGEKSMRWALCFFPAVGVVCGGVLYGWYALSLYLNVSAVLFGAVAACLPLLLTGGIHMDGYMDTVDALSSHRSREEKLTIMKDPHCGAFAAIYGGIYLLVSFGLYHEMYRVGGMEVYCLVFVLSRSLSALCAVTLPDARRGGMLSAYTKDASRRAAAALTGTLAVLAGAAAVCLRPWQGGAAVVCAAAVTLCYRMMAKRVFGGVTGDTAGFFLQLCELVCLAGVWAAG